MQDVMFLPFYNRNSHLREGTCGSYVYRMEPFFSFFFYGRNLEVSRVHHVIQRWNRPRTIRIYGSRTSQTLWISPISIVHKVNHAKIREEEEHEDCLPSSSFNARSLRLGPGGAKQYTRIKRIQVQDPKKIFNNVLIRSLSLSQSHSFSLSSPLDLISIRSYLQKTLIPLFTHRDRANPVQTWSKPVPNQFPLISGSALVPAEDFTNSGSRVGCHLVNIHICFQI